MSGPFRQTDAILTIAQDNIRHAVQVTASNAMAEALVGKSAEELKGADFLELLPERIAAMLEDYIEFEEGANDVGDVLRKIREFQLKTKKGIADFRLRVLRHHSQNLDEYMLILQDESDEVEHKAVLSMLREQMSGHSSLDPETGLPDRSTILKSLELIELHGENIPIGSCFAVLEVDAYEAALARHGILGCTALLKHVAMICSQNLRGNDLVMQFDHKCLALILVGTTAESTKMVLNRLRWLVAGQKSTKPEERADLHTTLSILFSTIDSHSRADELLTLFEKKLAEKPQESTNLVVEI